jgi:hypothetical protein
MQYRNSMLCVTKLVKLSCLIRLFPRLNDLPCNFEGFHPNHHPLFFRTLSCSNLSKGLHPNTLTSPLLRIIGQIIVLWKHHHPEPNTMRESSKKTCDLPVPLVPVQWNYTHFCVSINRDNWSNSTSSVKEFRFNPMLCIKRSSTLHRNSASIYPEHWYSILWIGF